MRARVSAKGQVVIPQRAREILRLTAGTELEVELGPDRVIFTKARKGSWRIWRGRFRGVPLTEALEEEHRAERRRDTEGP